MWREFFLNEVSDMHAQRWFGGRWLNLFLFLIGGLCGGSRMAALKEGSGLASVQKHLHGMVCDGSHLWSDQCCYHGDLCPCYPVSTWLRPKQGRRKKPLQCAPGGNEVKFGGQNISLTSGRRREKKKFDMCLWFLAASFSSYNLLSVPFGSHDL